MQPKQTDIFITYNSLKVTHNHSLCLPSCVLKKSCSSSPTLHAIDNASGIILPSKSYLILGGAGSGRTTLLRVLANRTSPDHNDMIKYKGYTATQIREYFNIEPRRLLAYTEQTDDLLNPQLTVEETLQFYCQLYNNEQEHVIDNNVNNQKNKNMVHDDEQKQPSTNYNNNHHQQKVNEIITLLGLEKARHTICGVGLSGGEKRRVNIGINLCSNSQVCCIDQLTDGLDAHIAYNIIQSLCQNAINNNTTFITALNQPSKEIFECFDNLILLNSGHIVYNGPCDKVLDYMASIGYFKSDDVATAEWLISLMLNPQQALIQQQIYYEFLIKQQQKQPQQQYYHNQQQSQLLHDEQGIELQSNSSNFLQLLQQQVETISNINDVTTSPITPQQMADRWQQSQHYTNIVSQLQTLHSQIASVSSSIDTERSNNNKNDDTNTKKVVAAHDNNNNKGILINQRFSIGGSLTLFQTAWSIFTYQFITLSRLKASIIVRILSGVVICLLYGGLFWNIPKENFFMRISAIASLNSQIQFANLADIPIVLHNNGIAKRDISSGLYSAWVYCLSLVSRALLVCWFEATLFGIIFYFMMGNVLDISRFFIFWGMLLLSATQANVIFTFIATCCETYTQANIISQTLVSLTSVCAGFFLTRKSIPTFLLPLYWLSPGAWVTRALAINEFRSSRYSQLVPSPPIDSPNQTTGELYLTAADIFTNSEWIWAAVLFMVSTTICLFVLQVLILQHKAKWFQVSSTIGSRRLTPHIVEKYESLSSSSAPLPPPLVSKLFLLKQTSPTQTTTTKTIVLDMTISSSSTIITSQQDNNMITHSVTKSDNNNSYKFNPSSSSASKDTVEISVVIDEDNDQHFQHTTAINKTVSVIHNEVINSLHNIDDNNNNIFLNPHTPRSVDNPAYNHQNDGNSTRCNIKNNSNDDDNNNHQQDEYKYTHDDQAVLHLPTIEQYFQTTPSWLYFQDITYTIKTQQDQSNTSHIDNNSNEGKTRVLLNSISGFAQPGQILALLGPSGSSKTTLLNILSLRTSSSSSSSSLHGDNNIITGNILLNGQRLTQTLFAQTAGFVEQFYDIFPYSNVYNTLLFAARLRLSTDINDDIKIKIVYELMILLDLITLQYTIVSDLSPAEIKKLSIGLELITNPSILFLDECTTGLDGPSAAKIIAILRRIATKLNKTIILSIHQPTIECQFLFDRICLLSQGQQLFFGFAGLRWQNVIRHFESHPSISPLPQNYNPGTWVLQQTSQVSPSHVLNINNDKYNNNNNNNDNDSVNTIIAQNKQQCEINRTLEVDSDMPTMSQLSHTDSLVKHFKESHIYNILQQDLYYLNFILFAKDQKQNQTRLLLKEDPQNDVVVASQNIYNQQHIIHHNNNSINTYIKNNGNNNTTTPTNDNDNTIMNTTIHISSNNVQTNNIQDQNHNITNNNNYNTTTLDKNDNHSIELVTFQAFSSTSPHSSSIITQGSNSSSSGSSCEHITQSCCSIIPPHSIQQQHVEGFYNDFPLLSQSIIINTNYNNNDNNNQYSNKQQITTTANRPSKCKQFQLLFIRNHAQYWSSSPSSSSSSSSFYSIITDGLQWNFNTIRLCIALLLSLIIGLLYHGATTPTTQTQFISRICSFGVILYFASTVATASLPCFIERRQLFYREVQRGYYSRWMWATVSFCHEIIWLIPYSIFAGVLLYWMNDGPATFYNYILYVITSYLTILTYVSTATCLSSISATMPLYSTLISIFMGLSFLFSSMNITLAQMADGWKWLVYIMPLHKGTLQAMQLFENDYILISVINNNNNTSTLMPARDFLSSYVGMSYGQYWYAFGYFMIYIFITQLFHHLGIIYLHFDNNNKK